MHWMFSLPQPPIPFSSWSCLHCQASDEAPPAPIRGPNCQSEEDEVEVDDDDDSGAGGGAGVEEPQMSLADLMPKVDIR